MSDVKVFASFSGLLVLLKRGFVLNDNANCIYMFGSTKRGIDETFETYGFSAVDAKLGRQPIDREKLLAALDAAESEGRCAWRQYNNGIDSSARVTWLLERLKERGVAVCEPLVRTPNDVSAGWNLPALELFLTVNAPAAVFVNDEYWTKISPRQVKAAKRTF